MRKVVFDNKNVWVTADTHIGHANIIKYCLRPPLTMTQKVAIEAAVEVQITKEMLDAHDNLLIENINKVVKSDDVLIHGGDVGWRNEGLGLFRDKVKCKKVIVAIGNHDNENSLKHVFGEDCVLERFLLIVDGVPAVVDHYPGDSWFQSHRGCWQLYGHVHGRMDKRHALNPGWSLSLDVGVDSHDYKPWSWQHELLQFFKNRENGFDAWREKTYARPKERGGMAREV